MFGMAGNLVMMLVDRIALARYSEATLIASGPAVFTGMTIIMFVTGIVGITRSYVAQAHGRGDHDGAADEGVVGMLLAVTVAVLMLLATPLVTRIPELSSRPADSVALEAVFLEWSVRFGAVMALNMALASYFNGTRRTRVPMVVGLIGQAVGAIMAIGLIFGRFGLPELGMRGSGIATFIAVSVMCAGYVVCLPRTFYSGFARVLGGGARYVLKALRARLGKGGPSGGSAGLEEMGHASAVWIAGILGPIALAANNVALSLNYVAIIPLIGLGVGCSILTGNAIGENKHERIPHIMRAALTVGAFYVLAIAFVQIFLPTLLLAPFGLDSANPLTMSTAVDTSRVLWMYAVAFMFSMFGGAVLESFGLTRFVFLTRVVVVWLLSVPTILVIAMANRDSSGALVVIWVVYSLFEAVMGALYFWRIRRASATGENRLVKQASELERSAESDVQPV